MPQRVAGGSGQIAPLGLALMVEPVGAARGAEVIAVGDRQRGNAGAAQGGGEPVADLTVVVDAVHDDCPGAASSGHEPGWHRAKLTGDLDRAEGQAASIAWIAGVDVAFEAGLEAGHEIAPHAAEATGDGLLAFADYRPRRRRGRPPRRARSGQGAGWARTW